MSTFDEQVKAAYDARREEAARRNQQHAEETAAQAEFLKTLPLVVLEALRDVQHATGEGIISSQDITEDRRGIRYGLRWNNRSVGDTSKLVFWLTNPGMEPAFARWRIEPGTDWQELRPEDGTDVIHKVVLDWMRRA